MNNDQLRTYVENGIPWDQLPTSAQTLLGNSRSVYHDMLMKHCLAHQLPFETIPIRFLASKQDYYAELVSYLRKHLRLYPYQFSDYIVNELKTYPFQFYIDMLVDIMKSEKSYDVLPNFTAADVVRLIDVGRNQYIDIMNKARGKKWTWKLNKGIVRDFLPTIMPEELNVEYWWILKPCPIIGDPNRIYATLNQAEITALECVRKTGAIVACQLNREAVISLCRKNLLYIDVPVDDNDYISVPPLKGFVMNRITDDQFEKLMYDVLVTMDERTSVTELASILEVHIGDVKRAVSMYLRLGFAKKKLAMPNLDLDPFGAIPPGVSPQPDSVPESVPVVTPSPPDAPQTESPQEPPVSLLEATTLEPPVAPVIPENNDEPDAPIMLPTFPSPPEQVQPTSPSLIAAVEPPAPAPKKNGDIFFDPSWNSNIAKYHEQDKPSQGASKRVESSGPDMFADIEASRHLKRIGFLFDSSLTAYLMMGNLAEGLKSHAVTLFEAGKMPDEQLDEFLVELDRVDDVDIVEGEARRYYEHAITLRNTLRSLRHKFEIPETDGGVDLIRCESLNNLDPPTKLRILDKGYNLLIAMAPLAPGALVLPGCVPRFYGPPIAQVSSAWFRFYVYQCAKTGPPCILFVKGARPRRLPKLFLSCEKLSIGGWDQDPNLIHTNMLLQVLNDSLLFSPVVVQTHTTEGFATDVIDVPFPYSAKNQTEGLFSEEESLEVERIIENLVENLHLQYAFGYVKIMRQRPKPSSTEMGATRPSPSSANEEEEEEAKIGDDAPTSAAAAAAAAVYPTDVSGTEAAIVVEDNSGVGGAETDPNKTADPSSSHAAQPPTLPEAVQHNNNNAQSSRIFPVDLNFGLPLSNKKMNAAIFGMIVERQLFKKEHIDQHTRNMRQMCTEFLSFISDNISSSARFMDGDEAVPLPTHNIIFDGSALSKFEL